MLKIKNTKKRKYGWITIPILVFYVLCAGAVTITLWKLNVLPSAYFGILSGLEIAVGIILGVMQIKKITAVLASVLSLILGAGLIAGNLYLVQTEKMLSHVTNTKAEESMVSIYVLKDSPAQSLADVKDFKVGILTNLDYEHTKTSLKNMEEEAKITLGTAEYDNMFTMLQELSEGKLRSIILNDAYVPVIGELEGYAWVPNEIRKVKTVTTTAESTTQAEAEIPENIPDSFILYISGIDTYGGISARSRSDVNILAVVNTRSRDIFLLSTPRDYYVDFSVTGGQKDKLTHAGIYGIDTSMEALEKLYGIQIDYYLRMNFTGFIDIIDALGGIDVYSDYDFSVENVRSYTKGTNHVNGLEALAFARERYSFQEGDYQRAKNQMEVIRAVIQKCASSALLSNYTSIMEGITGSFETSVPKEQIGELVKMQIQDTTAWNITSYTVSGTGMTGYTYSLPGQAVYVIEPSLDSVAEAKGKIQEIQGKTDK